MSFIEVLLIALSMAMDAFAVALGAASSGRANGQRTTFRLSFHFGLFQFLLPLVGWFAGATVARYFTGYDHWFALILLAVVGIRMIRSGLDPNGDPKSPDPSRGWTLVMLSLAVSIDALAIGLSLALVGVSIWYPAVVIGVVTALMTWFGLRVGDGLGKKFGKRMEVIGGIVLIGIGLRILASHLLGW